MVHISGISKQFVNFNPTTESLTAGKLEIKAGMQLKVFIAKVDFPARRLDFAYVQGSAKDVWNGGRHADETRKAAIAKTRGRKGNRGKGNSRFRSAPPAAGKSFGKGKRQK
jgi:hypothetical protein